MKSALAVLVSATSAAADCPDLTVLACDMGAKRLEVCADDARITYAFGPKGAPELTLSNPLDAPGFTPWPGVSRTIWDVVDFVNEDVTYEVFTSTERIPADEAKGPTRTDAVVVLKEEEVLADFRCDPDTVEGSVDLLYDHLTAHGMCFDLETRTWARCP